MHGVMFVLTKMIEISFPAGLVTGFAIGLAMAHLTKRSLRIPDMYKVIKGTELKMALVVRTDLGMRKGKTAAQCSHAALGSYRIAKNSAPELLEQWEAAGQPKIILKLDEKGEDLLYDLYHKALEKKLIACVIRDAGRTQIPKGSATVLSIGPGPAPLIDSIVGHLKLL